MKVIFLSKYGYKGASSRYRFYNYRKYFKDFQYDFKPLLSDNYIDELYKTNNNKLLLLYLMTISILKRFSFLLFSSSKNLYVIEKELFPNAPYIIEFLLLWNKKYCLDFDDYVGASYTESKLKKIFLKSKLKKLVSKSSLTTVGNHWYFEIFDHHKSLQYLPTNIEIEKYKNHKKIISEVENCDEFSLVWIGSPSTAKYLDLVKDAFYKLAANYNVKFYIIGGRASFDHPSIQYIKWDEKTEIENISKGDIGIMPLYDTLWEKGKCGFKLIQYMGVGLPVLASKSPANAEIILNNGFVCKNENDWYNNIEYLILNKEERILMGEKSFERAKGYYSYEKWGPYYSSLILQKLHSI